MTKKKNPAALLSHNEWIQLLTFDQDGLLSRFFSEEVSILTKTVIMLAIVNAIMILVSIASISGFFDETLTMVYFVASALFLIVIIIAFVYFHRRLASIKKLLEGNRKKLIELREDVINSRITNLEEIREKYNTIMEDVKRLIG